MTTDPHHAPAGSSGGSGVPSHDPPSAQDFDAAGRTPSPRTPGITFFNRVRALGIIRPDDGRLAAGVCAGLAQRLGVDPLLIRGVFVVLSVIGGFGVGLYGLGWLLLPHPDGRIHAEGVLHGTVTAGFIGSVLLIVADLLHNNGRPWGWGPGLLGVLVPLAVIAFVWWLIVNHGSRRKGPSWPQPPEWPSPPYPSHGGMPGSGPGGMPGSGPGAGNPEGSTSGTGPGTGPGGSWDERGKAASFPTMPYGAPSTSDQPYPGPYPGPTYPAQPHPGQPSPTQPPLLDLCAPSHPLTLTVLGLALVGAAVTVLWDHVVNPLPAHAGLVALGVALAIVAIGVVVAGLLGRRSGGLAPIAVLLALLSIGGAVGHGVDSPLHDQIWRPASADSTKNGYTLGVGEAVLDLTQPQLTAGRSSSNPIDFPVQLGVGKVRIVVPDGTAVQIEASVGAGNIVDDVNGNRSDSSDDVGGAGVKQVINAHGDQPVIIVRANVGLGSVEIEPQRQAVTP
jgi:phage shock protein PspC (stress-responsive transcriptional regulator)